MTQPEPQPKNSDLGVRVASAIVMVVVAGSAFWLGAWLWVIFVALVALGVFWEWIGLILKFERRGLVRLVWIVGAFCAVGLAASVLSLLRFDFIGLILVLLILGGVICVDVGAYFAGRAIGGPKIAPAISPSKTWAGLGGGATAATAFLWFAPSQPFQGEALAFIVGPALAVTAQAGDFFESWMKRRAGVKDSGKLIPGHGGLFDRVDGLLAVCFVIGLIMIGTIAFTLASGGSLLPSPA